MGGLEIWGTQDLTATYHLTIASTQSLFRRLGVVYYVLCVNKRWSPGVSALTKPIWKHEGKYKPGRFLPLHFLAGKGLVPVHQPKHRRDSWVSAFCFWLSTANNVFTRHWVSVSTLTPDRILNSKLCVEGKLQKKLLILSNYFMGSIKLSTWGWPDCYIQYLFLLLWMESNQVSHQLDIFVNMGTDFVSVEHPFIISTLTMEPQ